MDRDPDFSPAELALPALRAAYLACRLQPRTLLHELLDRARRLQPTFHTYITLFDEAALEPYLQRLEAADPEALPLYGVPFAIKDNIDLAGAPTTAACAAAAYVPDASAAVVARLIELGAVPTGKTNLDQFATGLNGLRSPYGGCRNAVLPQYPSGGSSSGSALAVALGLASFALGTDTAGSGRVPAALNGLIGCKPTRGLLSTRGVVPCCPSLDCLSLFTTTAADAASLFGWCAAYDAQQPYSRRNPAGNVALPMRSLQRFRFGVPRAAELDWLGCAEGPALFAASRARLEALGGTAVEIDFLPFREAAQLLYAPAGAAERFAAFGAQLDHALPVIREIVSAGAGASAVDRVRGEQQLHALKRDCDAQLAEVDAVLTPTIARAFTIAEIEAAPIARNSDLGLYTNFMNLLDYAAVAVPAGQLQDGLPWGVTLFGRAYTDQYLLALAAAFTAAAPAAHTPRPLRPADRTRVVVCGAHLDGLPLNGQLTARGAHLVAATETAPCYRLYALPGGPPLRPALVRDASGGAVAVEVWELPAAELASFLDGIGAPLGLGKVELADGSVENAFICEHGGLAGAIDISAFGGWRAYLAQRDASQPRSGA